MAGADCCDVIIGGRVEVRTYPSATGSGALQNNRSRIFYGIGDARIQPQMFEKTAGMTNNGKLWVTVAPRAARLLMDYSNDCKSNIWDMIDPKIECKMTVMVWELDRNVIHQLRNASIVGFAELNLSTGIITGLEFASSQYKRLVNNQ